ncbi:MAG: DUF4270 family protein, partial [Bacteroidales bacterium]|nr:DUF4270 family protein [Bacteroidales bacterium]
MTNYYWRLLMNQHKILFRCNFIIYLFLSLFIILAISCKDDASLIGINLQPDEDLYELDSIIYDSLFTSVVAEKPLYTKNLDYACLGYYRDSLVGLTRTDFICNFYMPLDSAKTVKYFKSLDSVKLFLAIGSSYGDLQSRIYIQVYKLGDFPDDSIKSDFIPDDYATTEILGGKSYDSLENYDQIIINLDKQYFSSLLSEDSSNFKDLNNFHQLFPGLYVTTRVTLYTGQIAYINPRSDYFRNGIMLYYNDTLSTFLYLYNRFNRYEHEYNKEIEELLNSSNQKDSLLYIKCMGGIKSSINLPDFSFLKDSMPITINLARIEIPVNYLNKIDSNSYITLKLVTLSDDEKYISIIDYQNFPTNMYNKDKN